jgi:hypothetical protein
MKSITLGHDLVFLFAKANGVSNRGYFYSASDTNVIGPSDDGIGGNALYEIRTRYANDFIC